MNKKYIQLAIYNLVLAVVAICLYLPYTLEAFDMPGFEWFKFVPDLLKNNYHKTLIYFGLFLLLWFIALNLFTILTHANLSKVIFKISIISSLVLPLAYVLALEFDWALDFWVKTIAPNIKMIAYILLIVSWGSFVLGLIYNFTKRYHANLHHIMEALVMCLLITLLVMVNGWCGWKFDSVVKMYGLMVGLFAIYLPVSAIILFICRKKRC